MKRQARDLVEAYARPFYEKPERHYHNWFHIVSMLFGYSRDISDELYLATVFHDIVYEPMAPDNEEKSCEAFLHFFERYDLKSSLDFRPVDTDKVQTLIMSTKKHIFIAASEKGWDEDTHQIVRRDLDILWSTPSVFEEYEGNIRKEFAHKMSGVSKYQYLDGREAFMNSLKKYLLGTRMLMSWETEGLKANMKWLRNKIAAEKSR